MKKSYTRSVFSIIAAFFFIIVFIRYAEPIKDGDIWFHMAYGRYMVEHHTLIPDHTIYSWTPADNNTIYCAWIPEIILYLLYQAGGIPALFVFKYACITVILLLAMFFMIKKETTLNPITWLMVLTGILMCQSGMDIKPELFSLVLMTMMVWSWFMIRVSGEKEWMFCYAIPLVMLVWANSHGGFIFGMVFLASICLGEIMNIIWSPREALHAGTRRHFIISMAASLCVIFITPYGWRYPVQLFHDLVLNSGTQVQEFKTVWAYQTIFHPMAKGHHFIDYLIISAAVMALLHWAAFMEKRLNWSLVLSSIGLGLLYTQFVRTTYFWGVLCVFSSIAMLESDGAFRGRMSYNKGKCMAVISIIACVLISGREAYQTICKPLFGFWINYYSPIEEAEYLHTHLQEYRLGNDYNSGAYLIWALWPETKVFMDARYFPYKQWYKDYATFVYGKDNIYKDRFLRGTGCDIWLATYDFPAMSYFTSSPEWRPLHYGPSACIFIRKDRFIPDGSITSDKGIFSVRTFQALKILDFCMSIGEINNAIILADSLQKDSICPKMNREVSLSLVKTGDMLARKGYLVEAIRILNRAVMISGAYAEVVHNKLGELYYKKGDVNRALREYNQALDVQPEYVPALTSAAIAYSRLGNLDLSLKYLHRLAEIQPDNPSHLYNISCVLSRQNKIEEALYWLNLALMKGFNDWNLVLKDRDLENIRHTETYMNLLKKYGKHMPETKA